jgi:hypothetical protein
MISPLLRLCARPRTGHVGIAWNAENDLHAIFSQHLDQGGCTKKAPSVCGMIEEGMAVEKLQLDGEWRKEGSK